jgi:hypothetical protein
MRVIVRDEAWAAPLQNRAATLFYVCIKSCKRNPLNVWLLARSYRQYVKNVYIHLPLARATTVESRAWSRRSEIERGQD